MTSFDPAALDIARELAPGVPRGLLASLDFPIGQAVAAAGHLDVQVFAPHWGSLCPNQIESEALQRPLEYVVGLVHRSGRELLAWCPPPEFAPKLLAAGVDALCVNDVPEALASLQTDANRQKPARCPLSSSRDLRSMRATISPSTTSR